MAKLTEEKYWDGVWAGEAPEKLGTEAIHAPKRRRRMLQRILGDRRASRLKATEYSDHVLFDVLYKAHIPSQKQLSVLEVGSAPGSFLVKFSRAFGTVPYGVEYTESGAELNRRTFVEHGLDPAN